MPCPISGLECFAVWLMSFQRVVTGNAAFSNRWRCVNDWSGIPSKKDQKKKAGQENGARINHWNIRLVSVFHLPLTLVKIINTAQIITNVVFSDRGWDVKKWSDVFTKKENKYSGSNKGLEKYNSIHHAHYAKCKGKDNESNILLWLVHIWLIDFTKC